MKTLQPALLRHRTAVTVVANLAIAAVAYLVAFALRFDFAIPLEYAETMAFTLPLLLLCKAVAFRTANVYSGWWQHVSVRDALDIVHGNLVGSVLFLVLLVYTRGLDGFPRSVVVLDLVLCTSAMAGVRLAIRVWR